MSDVCSLNIRLKNNDDHALPFVHQYITEAKMHEDFKNLA